MSTTTNGQYGNLSKDERDLSRIVAIASGIGLGSMLALSEAVRFKDVAVTLQFSFRTAIVFSIGFLAAFAYLSRLLRNPERTSRLFFRIGLAVLLILVGIAFAYPLRLFAIGTLIVKLVGVIAALCFIAAGLTLVRCVVHEAEREEIEQEASEQREHNIDTPRPEGPGASIRS
jgi:hypothetical protein